MQVAFLTPLVDGRSNVQFLDIWNAHMPVGWKIGAVYAVAYMLVYVALYTVPPRGAIFHRICFIRLL